MPGDKWDYPSILADLEAKKAALESSIASLRAALAVGALGQTCDLVAATPGGNPVLSEQQCIELPAGALLGKSIPSAIKLYLSAVKKKQTFREIVTALREGGVESTAQNFEKVVTGALWRLKSDREVLRFKDGWALAEFYPESLRSRISQIDKASKKKPKRTKKTKPVQSGVVAGMPDQLGPEKRIKKYIAEQQGKRITTSDVSNALEMRPQTVALVLAKLAHAGQIGKNADGSFDVGDVEGPCVVN